MIISISRRCDIPALYSDWLMRRFVEGFVLVPNPYNHKRLRQVSLKKEDVDCIVFWTKNAIPILDKIPTIMALDIPFYFQYTITLYDQLVETNLPPKPNIVQSFIELSKMISPARIIWRCDPFIVNKQYPLSWCLEQFEQLCKKLAPYTKRCIISFFDDYPHLRGVYSQMDKETEYELAKGLVLISQKYHLPLFACSEEVNFTSLGIKPSACIDQLLIEEIIGYPLKIKKDPYQRSSCHCVSSVDIGVYNTCINGCKYCYATSKKLFAVKQWHKHDPQAPSLTGYPQGGETITIVKK